MKYIDAEKLKKIVEQAKQRALKGIEVDEDMYCDGRADAFGDVLLEIDSLQQEQPSLPSNLDEAAEKIAWDIAPMYPDISWDNCFEKIKEGIKTGAEWMAWQGHACEVDVKEDAGGYPYIPCIELYDYDKEESLFKPCDKVVIQIRKK